MSHEFPENIGELSRYSLEKAIERVDQALADAPEEIRKSVAVIKLITGTPRRAPWYGVTMPTPEGDTVSMGRVLGNAFEAVGDWPWSEPRKLEHYFTRRHYPQWVAGRREYDDYLDHLLDPLRWEQELAEKRMTDEEAAIAAQRAAGYLGRRWAGGHR